MDRKTYDALNKVYKTTISKLYERDIKYFLEEAKRLISVNNGGLNFAVLRLYN